MRIYCFPVILITSILLGGLFGKIYPACVPYVQPLGDVFLRVLLTAMVPLVFFSTSSAITRTHSLRTLGRLLLCMLLVFLLTGIVAAVWMLFVVVHTSVMPHGHIILTAPDQNATINVSQQLIDTFTVSDFSALFSHHHMIALILFAVLVGVAVSSSNTDGQRIIPVLQAGEAVFLRFFALIMYAAPIGFFGYFAGLVHTIGTELLVNYAHVMVIYSIAACLYFVIAFTFYAYCAGGIQGITVFWKNSITPAITAVATCSGIASIPANITAARSMRIAPAVYETVMPIGAIIHKDGSVMGGIVKIAFLFGLFHWDFSGTSVLLTAVGVSLLVGTVMGAIPSGGMLGELLILNFYGFPPSALMAIVAISIIIDPIATLLNVTGTTVSAMLINRCSGSPLPR